MLICITFAWLLPSVLRSMTRVRTPRAPRSAASHIPIGPPPAMTTLGEVPDNFGEFIIESNQPWRRSAALLRGTNYILFH